jgi:hypothetical protein
VICVNAAAEPGTDEIFRLDGFEFIEDCANFVGSEICTLRQREEFLFGGPLNRLWWAKWKKRWSKVCRLIYGDMAVDELVGLLAIK